MDVMGSSQVKSNTEPINGRFVIDLSLVAMGNDAGRTSFHIPYPSFMAYSAILAITLDVRYKCMGYLVVTLFVDIP